MTRSKLSTESCTVNLDIALVRCAVVSGPSIAALAIPLANDSGLSGPVKISPPQFVSGNPPAREATTRQPACWASTDTMPKVSRQNILVVGMITASCCAIKRAIDGALFRAATSCMPGCAWHNAPIMRPSCVFLPASVTVTVTCCCRSMDICKAASKVYIPLSGVSRPANSKRMLLCADWGAGRWIFENAGSANGYTIDILPPENLRYFRHRPAPIPLTAMSFLPLKASRTNNGSGPLNVGGGQ